MLWQQNCLHAYHFCCCMGFGIHAQDMHCALSAWMAARDSRGGHHALSYYKNVRYLRTLARLPRQKDTMPCSRATRLKQSVMPAKAHRYP